MATFDNINEHMPLGFVKTITSDHGTKLQFVELYLSETTKISFMYDEDNNNIQFSIEDENYNVTDSECSFDKGTLKDVINALKGMYVQLND